MISHAQLLIQVGNLERQCGLAGRTPDGKAWDLLSIPSCITVRDLARHFSLCVSLLLSKCSQALPSHSFTGCHGSLPKKQLGVLKNALLNVEVSSAFSESVI